MIHLCLSSNYLTGNLWSTSETTQSIYASNGGSYSLTVDLGNSCPLDTENIDINTIPNSQSSTEITICDDLLPYSWNGLTFNSAGSQTATLSSAAGCDSLATLNLTVNPEVSSTTDITICDDLLPVLGMVLLLTPQVLKLQRFHLLRM